MNTSGPNYEVSQQPMAQPFILVKTAEDIPPALLDLSTNFRFRPLAVLADSQICPTTFLIGDRQVQLARKRYIAHNIVEPVTISQP